MSVSVLLATYNSAKYLRQLMDSILGQTFGDIRLVIRDDCSTDGTADIIGSYNDSRIELIPGGEPSGSAQNNFFALLAARDDDYIMFADADDVWLPDKIERTLARMKSLEAERGADTPLLVHTDLVVADENLGVISGSLFRYEKISPSRRSLNQLLAQNNVTGCAAMINRALRALTPRLPESSVMHDWWLALTASAFGDIATLDEATVLYRQHGSNQVGAYDAGNLLLAAQKLARARAVRQTYSAMFKQAGCFAKTFSDRLSPAQLEMCEAYASMERRGKLGRIKTIVKYRFYKNTLIRNIGQLWAI
jgi:hypothetical protein